MKLYQYLSDELAASKQDISQFALSAPNKYKVYTIPKRTSGKRTIAHPSKQLKKYQRLLVVLLEKKLPVHEMAFAYKKKSSIKQNAYQHINSTYLLKMDFQNFFHSITPPLFFSVLEKLDINISKEDVYLLNQLLFWSPSKKRGEPLILSIGAPSSPLISNFIMYYFDGLLNAQCLKLGINYSRYADDITFSTQKKGVLFNVPTEVKKLLLKEFSGFITINEAKTVFSSKAHNRHITGITLTNDNSLSIGRKRKRYISSLIHKFSLNQLPIDDLSYLRGLLAFANDIEPDFKNRMIKKYSEETINKVVKESYE